MQIELGGDGGYNMGQEEAVERPFRTNGLAEANSTHTQIGDDCYDAQLYNVEMIGPSAVRTNPTIQEF